MEKNLKKNVSMCVTEYFAYAWNEYNIVNQLYFGLFFFFLKEVGDRIVETWGKNLSIAYSSS